MCPTVPSQLGCVLRVARQHGMKRLPNIRVKQLLMAPYVFIHAMHTDKRSIVLTRDRRGFVTDREIFNPGPGKPHGQSVVIDRLKVATVTSSGSISMPTEHFSAPIGREVIWL